MLGSTCFWYSTLTNTRAITNDIITTIAVQYHIHYHNMPSQFSQIFIIIIIIIILHLLPNSENREHLKNFRNVDCVLANHNKVQDTQANLKTTNLLPLLFAV